MTGPNDPKTLTCNAGHEFVTRATPGERARCPKCVQQGVRTRYQVPLPGGVREYAQKHRVKLKTARKVVRREAAEAALPLTDAQRELIARARQDRQLISRAAQRARLAQDIDAYGELQARQDEISGLLNRLIDDARERAETETARLMTGRVAVDTPGVRRKARAEPKRAGL